MRIAFTISLLLLGTACSTVTLTAKGKSRTTAEPTYTDRVPFYFGGLVGESQVDGKAICGNGEVKQIQTREYFLDGFLNVITLSIYSPRVLHIWCEGGKEAT